MSKRLLLCCCLVGLLGTWAPPASATHVSCGDVITQDTTVDSDLTGCPGAGLVIGAPGITLDLGGHTVAATEESQGQFGVDNTAGHDGVTVTNGTIADFFGAVRFVGAGDGAVSRLELLRGTLWLTDSPHNMIERNRVIGAVFLEGDSDDNSVARNRVTGGANGIFLSASFLPGGIRPAPDRNVIEQNVVAQNGFGVVAFGAFATTIARNTVTDNVGAGISNRSEGTLIEDNYVARNGFGSAIEDPTSGITSFNSLNTTVVGNHVVRNAVDGIAIGASARGHNVVARNLSQRNGDDGIDVDQQSFSQGSATITANKAHHNGDLGIEAVPGVTDGGGNKAHGNGNPLQCVGVRCK